MNDEEAIQNEVEAFSQAWSKGDAKTAASFFTEDAVRVGAVGDTQHGLQQIEAAFDKLLHATMPGATIQQERGSVRMLAPDLAVWQGGTQVNRPGNAVPLKGHVVQVMKKVRGRWLVLEAHPKFFPTPPPAQ